MSLAALSQSIQKSVERWSVKDLIEQGKVGHFGLSEGDRYNEQMQQMINL